MGCAPSPLPCQPSGVIKIQFPNSQGTFRGSLAHSRPLPRVQEGAEGWIAAGTDSPSVGASPPVAGGPQPPWVIVRAWAQCKALQMGLFPATSESVGAGGCPWQAGCAAGGIVPGARPSERAFPDWGVHAVPLGPERACFCRPGHGGQARRDFTPLWVPWSGGRWDKKKVMSTAALPRPVWGLVGGRDRGE